MSKTTEKSAMPVLKWYDYTTILIALEDYEARKNNDVKHHVPHTQRHIDELLPLRRKLYELRDVAYESNCFQHGYTND